MKNFCIHKKGFTIVELLVVIAIIGIIASVVMVSVQEAKKKSRDTARIAEIDQIQVALRIYTDMNGRSIDCFSGMKIDGQSVYNESDSLGGGNGRTCNDGTSILTFLQQHLSKVPHDPLGPGNKDYYYYLDTTHMCMSSDSSDYTSYRPMVFAVNLESERSNILDPGMCLVQLGNDGGLMNTTSYGGSMDPSKPFVRILKFIYNP